MTFQSTSLVRGTTQGRAASSSAAAISIHVPRERDDTLHWDKDKRRYIISIHVPRERDDPKANDLISSADFLFQSTSLVRGTTAPPAHDPPGDAFQSTSLVRGTTHLLNKSSAGDVISIHVPRERDDEGGVPMWRRGEISIHVPRERDDQRPRTKSATGDDFNPRPS